MSKIYPYIGPLHLMTLATHRQRVQQPQDVLRWVEKTDQAIVKHSVIATFIISADYSLWIADRHSEHVTCAGGQPVLSAGEITFSFNDRDITVSEITNQSTGYCPEPESWEAIAKALDMIGLIRPPFFTRSFIMRLCSQCGTKNIVKEGIFECGVCESLLSAEWNFGENRQVRTA